MGNSVMSYDNYPTYGGAAFIDFSRVNIDDCEFTNNHATDGSAIYTYDSKYCIDKIELNGNDNAIYTVFDQRDSQTGEISGSDEVTSDDFNNTYYPNMMGGTGMQIILPNNTENITDIPARYDLREKNLVTPVRNQGAMGACWAFGTIATLESALLKAMNYSADFSENNMQDLMLTYSIYGSSAPEGGDSRLGTGYLLSWLGAFSIKYDVYDELGKISPAIRTAEDIHIQDFVIIPNTPGDADSITNAKRAIIKYGSLTTILLSKSTSDSGEPTEYYNENTSAEYIPTYSNGNHEISIVGWDDNFSKDKFTITPPGDGAWIVKNSWGTGWGDEGYFYVSYYDKTLAANPNLLQTSFIAILIENTIPYNKNYQYDITGLIGGFYEDGNQVTYMNNFESYGDDLIAAVGTYFNREGVEYTVEINVNGESVYTQTGVSPYYGYHTIKLEKYIPIKEGDIFSASITSNAMPYCNDTRVHYKDGSSLKYSNGEWVDLGKSNSAACLKVYTVEDNRHNTTLDAQDKIIYVNDAVHGYDYQFVLKDENGTVLSNKDVQVSFNGETQTVTTDGKGRATATLKANIEGSYNVELVFKGDNDYREISKNATITLKIKSDDNKSPESKIPKTKVAQKSHKSLYKEKVVLTIITKEIKLSAKNNEIVISLKTITGKPIVGVKITITINGKTYTAITDENGTAKFVIDMLQPGNYSILAQFNGTIQYEATNTTSKISIY